MTRQESPRKSAVPMGPAGKWYVPMCSISLSLCTSTTSFNPPDPLTLFDNLSEREARMQVPHNPEDSYRLIVTRRKASEILLSQDGSGWTLPRVGIRPRQRVAEQLVSELHGEWGLETYCLFVPNAGTSAPNGAETKCAVMESVRHNDEAPAGTCWMPPSTAADCSDAREAAAIRESLQELDSYLRGEKTGPFARPGWLRELFRWTEEQVAPLGMRVTGGFRQWNASPTFSLVRMET